MDEQRLPKYHETFIPILEILSDGKLLPYRELLKTVRDKYYGDLPQEELDRTTKDGGQLILNRIGFGKAYLKAAKIVKQPERAMVQITQKGLEVLERGTFTLEDLSNDQDYINHKQQRKNGSTVEDSETPEELIAGGITELEDLLRTDLLDRLKDMDPYLFEKVILRLLKAMGYGEYVETAKSGDGGIDGIINQDQLGIEKIFIQAKRFADNKVREKHIRDFIGAMSGDTSKGVFVTTSSFDEGAMEKAKNAHHTIILIDGIKLADLMIKYNVGVQRKETYEVKEIDEDFFELE